MKTTAVVISCEHGGNTVPLTYQPLFAQLEEELRSHRAFDFGAFDIATFLSETHQFNFSYSTTTRLLIDCNRSLSNPCCFSEYTRRLPNDKKKEIIENYYLPHRQQTENYIKAHLEKGHQVLHLSIHTFTPIFNGKPRTAALGLLYDPCRHGEKEVARLWSSLLTRHPPSYRVRMNYPYRGESDSLTSYLRKKYTEEQYLGIEVETNQALLQDGNSIAELKSILSDTLKELLQLL